ncbi:hypothetical protein F443_08765 [Phytophthora nicotianae P1569]|uniref:Uncharacterized protein n=1 Tax=Phytophthora nicotianae P1569 TaxID=1317065 RepID=V9F858_PHYNI|nr:hypothetical protein F443_08765 [Phytophthora nicotianae P1569]
MSSGGSSFADLTSSPRSSSQATTRGGPAAVSTIDLADSSLDLTAVRALLSASQHVIDQTEALHELRQDQEVLRRDQPKYDVVRPQLGFTRQELTDCLNSLQELLDISRELEACRLRYHDLQLRDDEAVSEFQDRISTLDAQFAAASSFGVIIPPDTVHHIADLEPQLARSHSDLQVARDHQASLASELRKSATPHKATQAEVDRLEAAVERKTRRFRALSEGYERRLKVTDNTIATHSAELARLQGRLSTLDQYLQRVRAAISQRDQASADRSVTREGSAARDTIARLERRINQVENPRSRVKTSRPCSRSYDKRKTVWWLKRMNYSASLAKSLGEITDLRSERDQVQESLSTIAPLLPSAPSHKRARSKSSSPVHSTRSSKDRPIDLRFFSYQCFDPGSSSTRVLDSDTAESGSDSAAPESCNRDRFGPPSGPLSNAELADVPPTQVPRTDWIPVYRDRRGSHGHDVVSWSAQDVCQTSIVEMDVDLLFHRFANPMEWLVSLRDPTPPLGEWLVDEGNVRDLIESAPWEVLAAQIDPHTSDLRAYWDSTHTFQVSITKCRASRYLEAFYTDRKQRRSRAGARCKSFLQQVLICMLQGYCDLDLLLDPFFLHFPRQGEAGAWYPGIEDGADPEDLLKASIITDNTDLA